MTKETPPEAPIPTPELKTGRPYCTYAWKHKGRFFTCGYRVESGNTDQRCYLHAGKAGELRGEDTTND